MIEHTCGTDRIGRVYTIAGNSYYSVTTVLSHISDKSGIDKWRKTIGEKAAALACKKAARWGSDFHLLGESFLLNIQPPVVTPTPTRIFENVTPLLTEHVSSSVLVEDVLVSHEMKIAGRVDAIVMWDNMLAVLDFKLLNNTDRKWMEDYWIQTTIYALMYKEMYGTMPSRCVLVVGNKKTEQATFYMAKVGLWERQARMRVKTFHELIAFENKGLVF
jgi:hypothetical protein